MRFFAQPIYAPAIAARSNPPTLASTPTGSPGSGAFSFTARSTTAVFLRKASSVSPLPKPVTASAGAPVNAESTAAEVVVLPMPISPMPSASTPSAFAVSAASMPAAMAASACSRVIAGPSAILPVPLAILRSSIPSGVRCESMPTSITRTSFPKNAAIADIPVMCFVMFTDWASVTLCGVTATPSFTTPLSAAKTATRQRPSVFLTLPVTPASLIEIVSSLPRLPGGFASSACRLAAASAASASAGAMAEIIPFSSCSVISDNPYRRASPSTRGSVCFQR